MQRIKNAGLILLNLFGIGLILSRSYDLIFNPTLFVDEGLYLGASRAVLDGDFFLRGHIFDKPFLLPFWPLLGLVSFGLSPLGARFVALILYLVSFVVFQKALNRLAQQPWINYLLALILFQLPTFQSHGISAFAEPYIIFCFTMCLYYWAGKSALRGTEALPEGPVLNWFWAGVFTKYSVILWAPLFIVSWSEAAKGRWFAAARDFLLKLKAAVVRHWIWFAFCLLFSLTNAAKFGSIAWFSWLGKMQGERPSYFELIASWSNILTGFMGFTTIAWILVAIAIFLERKHIRKNPLLLGVGLATLAHFAVIIVTGILRHDRYLVILVPGVFLFFSLLIMRMRVRSRLLCPIVSVLLVVWVIQTTGRPKNNVGGSPELGRLMSIANQELDHPDVILHTHYLWWMSYYTRSAIRTGCTTDDCVRFYREGVKEQPLQFALYQRPDGRPVLLRGPIPVPRLEEKDVTKLAQSVLASLRMGKWANLVEARVMPDAGTLTSGTQDLFAQFQPLHQGSRLLIRAEGKGHTLGIEATVAQTNMHEYPSSMNQRRWRPVAVIHQFSVDGHDVTDLAMPLFFGGYVQKI